MKSVPFFSSLLALNHLDKDCTDWLFLPGMLFKETKAWWKNTPRQNPHEGIDLLFLANHSGPRRELPPQALVPPLLDGEVIAVFDDFLGSTVTVRHPVMDKRGWRLISLYGHIHPLVGCGEHALTGKSLGTVAAGMVRGSSAPPDHLHLSLAWLAPGWPPTELRWPALWTNPGILLVDPLAPGPWSTDERGKDSAPTLNG
ncbi:MAG: hypothetical protein WC256_01970 [Desulfurivibrionaceae bacterium]